MATSLVLWWGTGIDCSVQLVPFQWSATGVTVPAPVMPTAVQDTLDVHDTLVSPVPGGATPLWMVHAVPSQRSASVLSAPLARYPPTAVHCDREVQDTSLKPGLYAPAGVGGARTVQLVPFHCSASGLVFEGWLGVAMLPTAMQAVADRHETALRLPAVTPAGRGTCWTVQLAPFQCSATGSSWGLLPLVA